MRRIYQDSDMRTPTECLVYIRLQNWYPAAKLNEYYWRIMHCGPLDRHILDRQGERACVIRAALSAGLDTYWVARCDDAYSDFLNR